jgi:hypothetical protein
MRGSRWTRTKTGTNSLKLINETLQKKQLTYINLCSKMTNLPPKKSVHYNRVLLTTEFVITEFHCSVFQPSRQAKFAFGGLLRTAKGIRKKVFFGA